MANTTTMSTDPYVGIDLEKFGKESSASIEFTLEEHKISMLMNIVLVHFFIHRLWLSWRK